MRMQGRQGIHEAKQLNFHCLVAHRERHQAIIPPSRIDCGNLLGADNMKNFPADLLSSKFEKFLVHI